MTVFGLSQTAIRAGNAHLFIYMGLPYFLIRTLQQLGQGELHMFDNALYLLQTLFPCFIEKRLERALMQPLRWLGLRRNSRYLLWRLCGRKVSQHVGFAKPWFTVVDEFHRKDARERYGRGRLLHGHDRSQYVKASRVAGIEA